MPELPEVETYARDLAGKLPGRVFSGARADWPRQLPRNSPEELGGRLAGQVVLSVGRRGKYLRFDLSGDVLLVHLKMSGRLQLLPAAAPPNPHAHVVFSLDGGDELRFHDPRKFGRVYLLADPAPVLGPLGPEPLAPGLDPAWFTSELARRRTRLKPLLLDQTFLAGLGNIYVDESLWAAGLHPLRPACTLAEDEARRLFAAIRDVLARAVAARGTSFSAAGYRDLTGNRGEMQGSLAVFDQTGRPCLRCETPVVKTVVAGRGTHWCPACQAAPGQGVLSPPAPAA
jgi:formamidopyrimidine-DNA glycosylase